MIATGRLTKTMIRTCAFARLIKFASKIPMGKRYAHRPVKDAHSPALPLKFVTMSPRVKPASRLVRIASRILARIAKGKPFTITMDASLVGHWERHPMTLASRPPFVGAKSWADVSRRVLVWNA